MVELIGDDCQPSSITIPTHEDNTTTGDRVGSLKMSGSKLYVMGASIWEVVTSA